ncbi:MAG: flagellar protein FlgN [Deltaproteobacteria bacterium]|nr:flagellar protein FlgN [Deltaproteobacteria bacterium]
MIYDKEETIIRLSNREIEVLREFLKVLKEERNFIISFSVEGIIECNNKKESLLKKIEFIEMERKKLMETLSEKEKDEVISKINDMKDKYLSLISDIKAQMERNMGLLSFSMDNMKGIIENIIESINKNMEYARGKMRSQGFSLLFSREA